MAEPSLDDCLSWVNRRTASSLAKSDVNVLDLEDVIFEQLAKARAMPWQSHLIDFFLVIFFKC